MTVHTAKDIKLFTVEQANATLPLVRAITRDVVQLAGAMIERRERLDQLRQGRDGSEADLYSEELLDVERTLEQDAEMLKGYVAELVQLGVQPKSLPEGLIDFPSMLNGKLVLLCWKYDEGQVGHWHEWDAGFAGRQPIDVSNWDCFSD